MTGSVWYVFGLERIDSCWKQFSCNETERARCPHYHFSCKSPDLVPNATIADIKSNCTDQSIAFGGPSLFDYGIYTPLILLIQKERSWHNYLYSLWWGLQQIW